MSPRGRRRNRKSSFHYCLRGAFKHPFSFVLLLPKIFCIIYIEKLRKEFSNDHRSARGARGCFKDLFGTRFLPTMSYETILLEDAM
jgi:hypothetical protein